MISVKMLDSQGDSLERASVFSIYATDMKSVPFNRKAEFMADGEIRFNYPGFPVMFNALVPIPGFGRSWITIDNCGEGYKDGAEIEFVCEAAASRAHLVEKELKKGGFAPSPKCLSMLNDAKYLIKTAEKSDKACKHYMMSLSAGMWAGELLALERARARIKASPKRENFLFGCGGFNYPMEKTPGAKEMYDSIFNYATLPFYLGNVEPVKGKPDYEKIDKLYEEFTKSGVKMKGHPLWWGFFGAGMPDWLAVDNWDELKKTIEYICKERVSHYKGRVEMFDVINEAHDWTNGFNLTQEQQVESTKIACDSAHEANPNVKAVVNACLPFAEYAGQGEILYGPVYERIMSPYSYFEKVRDRGVNFDVIGLQLYNPGRDMLSIEMLIDRYAGFGKPIHFTELGVASYKKNIPYNWPDKILQGQQDGIWHEFEWNERLQADWLEAFYTICYAHPSVEATTWWSFGDPGWVPSSGLTTETGIYKECCFRLKELEKSWGFDFGKA